MMLPKSGNFLTNSKQRLKINNNTFSSLFLSPKSSFNPAFPGIKIFNFASPVITSKRDFHYVNKFVNNNKQPTSVFRENTNQKFLFIQKRPYAAGGMSKIIINNHLSNYIN